MASNGSQDATEVIPAYHEETPITREGEEFFSPNNVYITKDGGEAVEDPEDEIKRSPSSSSSEYDLMEPNERQILTRLATSTASQRRGSMASSNADPSALERRGTLDGVDMGDEVRKMKSSRKRKTI